MFATLLNDSEIARVHEASLVRNLHAQEIFRAQGLNVDENEIVKFPRGVIESALMCFDFGKTVTDGEIALMLKRLARGFQFNEENLSLDVIAETGPAGMFIDKAQTYALMKETMLIPEIADRDPRQRWEKMGALDAQGRALKRVRELFAKDHASFLDEGAEARIREQFAGLPSGECRRLEIGD